MGFCRVRGGRDTDFMAAVVRTATVSKVVRRPPYFQQNVQKASDAAFRPAAYTPL